MGYNTGLTKVLNIIQILIKDYKIRWNINDNNSLLLFITFECCKDKPAHPSALGFRGPDANTPIRKIRISN
jgi:hypothetical protein